MAAKKFILNKETRDEMAGLIQKYYFEERGEELGDLGAMMLLDFITEKLGPHFYNLGVQDSYQYLSEKMEDLFDLQKY
ncbi:DUF2164 domain-containing protein [Bacillus sp. T33-2]|uniref:DUF2164 domain-containing protein n=1 Tax=Bacillus sp. T33-2 TaxID=2054168 RepID=UPI0021555517|nr:DUF2164 domain-containing protein [Bacillus sp. T33-2]